MDQVTEHNLETPIGHPVVIDTGLPVDINGWIIDPYVCIPDGIDGHRITIEARGHNSWAICQYGMVLDHANAEWVFEPMPSHRTEVFVRATRFKTAEAAFAALALWRAERRLWCEAHGFKVWSQSNSISRG